MQSKNKTAIVTGASSGIGKALAIHLANNGYTLLLLSRNQEKLIELEKALVGSHCVAAVDVANSTMVQEAVDNFLARFGQIDLLFNSAGYVKSGTSLLAEDEFLKMINANLLGTFNLIHAVLPSMKEKNAGYIINIASISGKRARATLGGYAASKFAVVGFCEALYKELAETGICVTTICPGLVATPMTDDVKLPREEMLQTSDIVKSVDYLLSLSPNARMQELVLHCRAQING